MIESLEQLDHAAAAAVEAELARFGRGVDADYRAEVIDDLRAWFADHLDAGATAADVREVARSIGEPTGTEREGWFSKVPIDLKPPTAERVAHTWWNPRDERLMVPRVFGLGWSLNFGAAAVKLGLIEPDAEDEPFESTPAPALRAALAVPSVLTAAVAAHYLFRWRGLPERLPSQLGATGRVSGWTSRSAAAAVDISVAAVPTLWAAWRVGRGATGARAAGAVAAATAASSITVGLATWRTAAVDGRSRPWAGPGLVGLLWLPAGAVLLALALAGRDAERRHDQEEGR